MKSEKKPTAAEIAKALMGDAKEPIKVMGAPKEKFDFEKMTNEDGTPISEEVKVSLKEVEKTMNESEDPLEDDDFIANLVKIQKESGSAESQIVLDRIIAMREAKKNGKLPEFFAEQAAAKMQRQVEAKEKNGLKSEQRIAIHKFMNSEIKCDEYIVICLTERKEGLQMEVLTQLPGEMVQSVLESIVGSIRDKTGIEGTDEVVED